MTLFKTLLVSGLLASVSSSVMATERPTERPPQSEMGWSLSLGAGTIFSPNYLGDDAYSLSVVPYLRITHSDRFFASVEEGVGYNLVNEESFRLGPLIGIEFGREEDQGGPFQVAGSKTTDLIGLGDIDTSISLGGFAEMDLGNVTASLRLGQAISGHEGLTGDIGLRYKNVLTGYGPPLIYSFGPSLNFGNDDYHSALFSITPEQAMASGLSEFDASGGIVSYSLGGTAIMPVTDRITLTLFGNIAKLEGDAANSSLVRERGSRNQAFIGLATAYTF